MSNGEYLLIISVNCVTYVYDFVYVHIPQLLTLFPYDPF
jgi:hypothetical protein